jgi:hypothetical protein
MRRFLFAILLICVLPTLASLTWAEDQLTPAELIARHLQSLGDPAARAAARSRAAQGSMQFREVTGRGTTTEGVAMMACDGRKLRLAFNFPGEVYPGEDVLFDGAMVQVGQSQPRTRSSLGYFLYSRDDLIKEGLLGGTLSTGWALLDVEARAPRLKYAGVKKIDGRELLQLNYEPRKGDNDLNIQIFFQPETFRHVMTVYSLTIPPPMTRSRNATSHANEGHYTLRETFSEFRILDGLNLPSHWTLEVIGEGATSSDAQWQVVVDRMQNVPVDESNFKVR